MSSIVFTVFSGCSTRLEPVLACTELEAGIYCTSDTPALKHCANTDIQALTFINLKVSHPAELYFYGENLMR